MLLSHVSLVIKTPEQFEELTQEAFGGNPHQMVTIEASAYPDVLQWPQFFADSKYAMLHFTGEHQNTVQLMPSFRGVEAHFFGGKDVIGGLPLSYDRYYVTFTDAVTIAGDDIKTILRWTDAKVIVFRGGDDIAYELYLRVNELERFEQLEQLELSVQRLNHVRVMVQPFLDALPALKRLSFDTSALRPEEKQEFIRNQGALRPSEISGNLVVYTK